MFNVRVKILAACIFAMMLLVLSRIVYMQVFQVDFYRQKGTESQISVSYTPAPRGAVKAREGTVLAEDLPVLNICVVLKDLYDMDADALQQYYAAVARGQGVTPADVAARVQAAWDSVEAQVARRVKAILSSDATPSSREKQAEKEAAQIRRREYRRGQVIYEDVGFVAAARAEVASADLPGLVVTQEMKRKYPLGTLTAHVVGYVNEITPEEWDLYRYDYGGDERKRLFYHDVMGRAGIEKQFNFEFKGARGRRDQVVNVHSVPQKILSDEPPVSGADVLLTIDPVMQKAALDALSAIFNSPDEPRAGAAVCMNVRTGEILVMASSPSYDPNTISDDYARLTDPDGLGRFHPFQNRATDSAYPLGSVFKVVTATAGLESGAITPQTIFTCDGVFKLGRGSWNCHVYRPPSWFTHGPLDMYEALKVSCNVYFYNVGNKSGGETLAAWARGYGLGAPTGIDLPSEVPGKVPLSPSPGDAVNLSIGQGALLVTPLQVCRMFAAIANGGLLLTPQLRREAPAAPSREVGVSRATLDAIRHGLDLAVNERGGTGFRNVKSDLLHIAGKSGTAQAPPDNGISGDHAWFAGFAPFENPEIAFAVVIEHGGHGGAVAGPVAKAMAEAYADRKSKGFAKVPPEEVAAR